MIDLGRFQVFGKNPVYVSAFFFNLAADKKSLEWMITVHPIQSNCAHTHIYTRTHATLGHRPRDESRADDNSAHIHVLSDRPILIDEINDENHRNDKICLLIVFIVYFINQSRTARENIYVS